MGRGSSAIVRAPVAVCSAWTTVSVSGESRLVRVCRGTAGREQKGGGGFIARAPDEEEAFVGHDRRRPERQQSRIERRKRARHMPTGDSAITFSTLPSS